MKDKKLPETITWKAASRQEHHRSVSWYLGFLLFAAGLVLFAIFVDRNLMTLITFALIIVVIFIYTLKSTPLTTYKLTKTGIVAGRTVYPYQIIKSFWIVYNPPSVKTLNFETTAYLNNRVSLQLGNQDPVMVKFFLEQYLVEDLNRDEGLAETLARTLKI